MQLASFVLSWLQINKIILFYKPGWFDAIAPKCLAIIIISDILMDLSWLRS
ncbi:hypothetical protein Bccel_1955 [Pseudobacteroides cellulosolvens ATCC 35603 = DSM 2933]|uniref:Uncharacterized protein n=1 Tax=Pseudobacteroides cellulosolvens ATCC 35603 = DSM 2933 TaxID=398512 RepID=A0A0L6JLR0_9FIRM|nr:hypothetical protein Bccel_1955 [Pseudobacteroides cellulosolvens ATCC 35603 = DSM 2933]